MEVGMGGVGASGRLLSACAGTNWICFNCKSEPASRFEGSVVRVSDSVSLGGSECCALCPPSLRGSRAHCHTLGRGQGAANLRPAACNEPSSEPSAEVRMQAQASQAPSRFFVCGNGITDHTFDIRCRQWRHLTRDPQPGRSGRPSMLSTLRSIYREAGVKGLYAGLPVTMLIAVPANVLYFATYESLRDYILAQRTLRTQRSGSSEAPAGPGRATLPLQPAGIFSACSQEFWLL